MTAKEQHRAGVFARDPWRCALAGKVPHRCTASVSVARGTAPPTLQADHVIELNWLDVLHKRRKHMDGVGLALDFDEVVADARNGWILCDNVHGLKTCGLIVIQMEWLPASVFEFNDAYDCAHLMDGRAVFAG